MLAAADLHRPAPGRRPGQNVCEAVTDSGNEWVQIWYLADPPTGANTVEATFGISESPNAVAALSFDDPVKEIEQRLGIGRTKSFAALSRALGAPPDQVAQVLDQLDAPGSNPGDPAD